MGRWKILNFILNYSKFEYLLMKKQKIKKFLLLSNYIFTMNLHFKIKILLLEY